MDTNNIPHHDSLKKHVTRILDCSGTFAEQKRQVREVLNALCDAVTLETIAAHGAAHRGPSGAVESTAAGGVLYRFQSAVYRARSVAGYRGLGDLHNTRRRVLVAWERLGEEWAAAPVAQARMDREAAERDAARAASAALRGDS